MYGHNDMHLDASLTLCPFSTLKAVGSPLGVTSSPIMVSWPDLKYPGVSFFGAGLSSSQKTIINITFVLLSCP